MEASIVMRLLWLRRNEYVFKGRFQPPSQVILSMKKTVGGLQGLAGLKPTEMQHSIVP
jgi:hypothetical protein